MRPIGSWRRLMSSTVSVAAQTGLDKNAKAVYGPDVAYVAHVSGARTLVRDMAGQQVVSSQAVWLNAKDAIQPTARVTLSTADVGSTESFAINPPILTVERYFDERGAHHTVLRLK